MISGYNIMTLENPKIVKDIVHLIKIPSQENIKRYQNSQRIKSLTTIVNN